MTGGALCRIAVFVAPGVEAAKEPGSCRSSTGLPLSRVLWRSWKKHLPPAQCFMHMALNAEVLIPPGLPAA